MMPFFSLKTTTQYPVEYSISCPILEGEDSKIIGNKTIDQDEKLPNPGHTYIQGGE
jgi:hypothetical protein